MNVHLYISSASHDDDEPFLTYDAKLVVERGSAFETRLPQAVVAHYIERLLHSKEVPFMIEEYLETRFQEEQTGGGRGEVYMSEMSLTDYRTMLRRIAGDAVECGNIFRNWTEVSDNYDTLVCVAETDLCAPFITAMYPPVEVYTRTVSTREEGSDGEEEEEEEEE